MLDKKNEDAKVEFVSIHVKKDFSSIEITTRRVQYGRTFICNDSRYMTIVVAPN
jgi:hypothetical protein